MTTSKKTAHQIIDKILAPNGPLSKQFKSYEFREEQAEMSKTIQEAIESSKHCLVEAGTGVGKTLAYLIPSVIAAQKGKVTVISTHTISLQSQLMEKDIPLVQSIFPQIDIKAVVMKGRGNYLCKQDLASAESDIFSATDPSFIEIKRWAKTTKSGDVAELPFAYTNWFEIAANQDTCRQKECEYYDNCFYYNIRRNATDANLIIVNHALFLSDLAIKREEPSAGILPPYNNVVLDEAHHIEDVATKVFGLEFTNRRLPYFVERVRRTKGLDINEERLNTIEHLNDQLFGYFDSERHEFFFKELLNADRQQQTETVATQLDTVLEGTQNELLERAKDEEGPIKDRLNGMARAAARTREELHTLIFRTEPEYVRWGQSIAPQTNQRYRNPGSQKSRTVLHHTPLEVGKLLETILWTSADTIILTSATLANSGSFSYIRSRLNVPSDAIDMILGSPFDYQNQALLYVPTELPEPPKGANIEYTAQVADAIKRLVQLSGGRAFLLFTSRRMLNDVYDSLKDKLDFPLFRQGDQPPGKLIEEFKKSGNGCLFGTQTFWEGVDVQGESLSCVIIDRLPFAVPDSPINKARVEAITDAGGDWFNEFSVPQAQIRLKQGFGRLIRTKNDRGIVCILDTRVLTKNYGKEFVKYLPPATRASKWNRVEQFWNSDNQD